MRSSQKKMTRPSTNLPIWVTLVLIILSMGTFLSAVAFVPEWWVDRTPELTNSDRIAAVAGVRQSVVFLGGGVLALIGIFYTHQRHMIETATNKLQQDSNYTDRYTAAVGQLGSDKLTIRLGGVYALERVARDSEGDRETVEDVLAAFIRADAPRAAGEIAHIESSGELDDFVAPLDVAAALTVLTRRAMEPAIYRSSIDLTGANIGPMQFPNGASLPHVILSGAYLPGARLRTAVLAFAMMDEVTATDVDLREAHLVDINFNSAHLSWADFSRANLTGAFFGSADLANARFSDSILVNANLEWANLRQADLHGADLEGAGFIRSDLTETNLFGTRNWEGAEFEKAKKWSLATEWPVGFTPSAVSKGQGEG